MAGVYRPRHLERTVLYRVLFPPHLHYLATEGGTDEEGVFHQIPRIDDSRLTDIFSGEVLAMLVRRLPSKGWEVMIRKFYEVDPMICPKCGGQMKVVAFITEVAVVDRIIDHLKLGFVAARPPPSHVFEQVALIAAEESGEYF